RARARPAGAARSGRRSRGRGGPSTPRPETRPSSRGPPLRAMRRGAGTRGPSRSRMSGLRGRDRTWGAMLRSRGRCAPARRVLLLVNATASSVTARKRVLIRKLLAVEHEVEVAETSRRGHAARLARAAANDGFDVVVVLAGDGTLNEAADGLL